MGSRLSKRGKTAGGNYPIQEDPRKGFHPEHDNILSHLSVDMLMAMALSELQQQKHERTNQRAAYLRKAATKPRNMDPAYAKERQRLIRLCKEKLSYIYNYEHAEDVINAVLDAYEHDYL